VLAPGMHADLALVDLDALTDHATFEAGRACASGVTHVFVNGRPVLWEGTVTGELPGRPAGREAREPSPPSDSQPPRKDVTA
jgi:N-acyl-D-amino-acid deacylase